MSIKETIEALREEADGRSGWPFSKGVEYALDTLIPEIALLESELAAATKVSGEVFLDAHPTRFEESERVAPGTASCTTPIRSTNVSFSAAKAVVARRFERAYFGRLVTECSSVQQAADVSRTDRPQLRRYLRRNGLPTPRGEMSDEDLRAALGAADDAAAAAWAAYFHKPPSEFEEAPVEVRDAWREVAAAVLGVAM